MTGTSEDDASLYVNDQRVIVQTDGSFRESFTLKSGDNVFKIKVVDLASNETEKEETLTYTPDESPTPTPEV